jgi:BMFP domain-containing protein YqiC
MVNKSKILSDLSKIAVDAMSTFSGLKKEIETLVSLRVNKIINKMNLVKRDEFEVLKKMVQKALIENDELKKAQKKPSVRKKKTIKKINGTKNMWVIVKLKKILLLFLSRLKIIQY